MGPYVNSRSLSDLVSALILDVFSKLPFLLFLITLTYTSPALSLPTAGPTEQHHQDLSPAFYDNNHSRRPIPPRIRPSPAPSPQGSPAVVWDPYPTASTNPTSHLSLEAKMRQGGGADIIGITNGYGNLYPEIAAMSHTKEIQGAGRAVGRQYSKNQRRSSAPKMVIEKVDETRKKRGAGPDAMRDEYRVGNEEWQQMQWEGNVY